MQCRPASQGFVRGRDSTHAVCHPNRPRDPRVTCLGAHTPPWIAGYFYDSDIGNYYYGQGHPMKPHRIRMAHNLLLNYGLYKKMEIYRPAPASFEEMAKFHSEEQRTFQPGP